MAEIIKIGRLHEFNAKQEMEMYFFGFDVCHEFVYYFNALQPHYFLLSLSKITALFFFPLYYLSKN